MSIEHLGRRKFFGQLLRLAAGAVAVAAIPKLPALAALDPIIEIGTPIGGFLEPTKTGPQQGLMYPKAFPGDPVNHLASLANELGMPVQELRALIALRQFGLSTDDLRALLWRLSPDEGLTDWTHHALALSEVGKP